MSNLGSSIGSSVVSCIRSKSWSIDVSNVLNSIGNSIDYRL